MYLRGSPCDILSYSSLRPLDAFLHGKKRQKTQKHSFTLNTRSGYRFLVPTRALRSNVDTNHTYLGFYRVGMRPMDVNLEQQVPDVAKCVRDGAMRCAVCAVCVVGRQLQSREIRFTWFLSIISAPNRGRTCYCNNRENNNTMPAERGLALNTSRRHALKSGSVSSDKARACELAHWGVAAEMLLPAHYTPES